MITPDFSPFIDELTTYGFAYSPNLFSDEFCDQILLESKSLDFKKAEIGKGQTQSLHQEIRSDFIYWLGEDSPPTFQKYLALISDYKKLLNRELFLGLNSFEGHLAKYPPGSFYRKHLDRHQNTKERIITTILYLNTAPSISSGGEIRLYQKSHSELIEKDIPPQKGAFLTFLSGEIYHEVLTSSFERYSLTGWLRTNAI